MVTNSKPITVQEYVSNNNLKLQQLRNDPLAFGQGEKPPEEIEALYSIIVNLLAENRRLKRRNVNEDESNILMDLANGNGFGAQIRPG
uniref:Uncharacterized protein n=1 Tax=Panagrolaimus sp. JU765 TaxID=591449 RepID=A0AC34PZ08_9BILA